MNPIVLLCTGGIGSGKSVVVKVFNALGIPSYDCDSRAKALYDEKPALAAAVERICGGGLLSGGRIDRKALAGRIFNDPSLLARVEAEVHPAVAEDFVAWCALQPSPVVILESAILLQKPLLRPLADKVLAVTAPLEERIRRVMLRDGVSQSEVQRRISCQASQDDILKEADYVVVNDGLKAVLPQAMDIKLQIEKYGKDRS